MGFRPVRTLPGSTLAEPVKTDPDPCPEMASYFCQERFHEVSPLNFSASEIEGEDVRFVAISTNHRDSRGVVGTRMVNNIPEVFLLVIWPWDEESGTRWTVNPLVNGHEDAHPVGIVYSAVENRYLAVMESPTGGFIAVSAATYEEEAPFAPAENADLPEGIAPRSLALADESVFVVGDGIAARESGQWEVLLPPESSATLHGVDVVETAGGLVLAAVGEAGQLVVWQGGQIGLHDIGVETDLLDVKIRDMTDGNLDVLLVGEDGLLAFGKVSELQICTVFDDALTVIEKSYRYYASEKWEGLFATASGEQLLWPFPISGAPLCLAHPPPGPLLSIQLYKCLEYPNMLYLTEEGIYGVDICDPLSL
jgi:hypothetical protein